MLQVAATRSRFNHLPGGGGGATGGPNSLLIPSPYSLMHFESDFTDEGGIAWTINGGAVINNSPTFPGNVFGHVANFPSANSYLSTPSTSDWCFGGQDFIIDFNLYINSYTGSYMVFASKDYTTSTRGWILLADSTQSNALVFAARQGSTSYKLQTTALSQTTWHHILVTRAGNTMYLFVDGVLANSVDVTGITFNTTTYPVYIGRTHDNVGGSYMNFQMDEFRVVVGQAGPTSAFTPPTVPYSNFGLYGYRYARLYCSTAYIPNRILISEVQFRAAVGGSDLTRSDKASKGGSASSYGYSATKSYPFDDNTGTYGDNYPGSLPYWIQWDFGTAIQPLAELAISNNSGSPQNMPKDFILQGSNDASSWDDIVTVSGESWAGATYPTTRAYS